MSGGDYLWDGSGEPDPEIQRLEAALRPLRRLPPPPRLPHSHAGWRGLAAAAAVLLAIATLPRSPAVEQAGWDVTWMEGATRGTERLRVGASLDTGDRHARVEVGRIGQLRLEPATRVSLVDAGATRHRLALERGTLHAMIWAPPGQFQVDTAAAVAVDLGCAYTLEVAGDGSGLLQVESGWVGFEHRGARSLVPAGAWCRTRPGAGPGTPRFATATPAFVTALDALDTALAAGAGASAGSDLERVLAEARARDALSLWHLLGRLDAAGRARSYVALARLVPPPPGVTREAVVAGADPALLELWWDELGLGSSEFWRSWTGPWTSPGGDGPPSEDGTAGSPAR